MAKAKKAKSSKRDKRDKRAKEEQAEAAKATALEWEPEGESLVAAHGYHCDPLPMDRWAAWHGEKLLGGYDDEEQAMERCQRHRDGKLDWKREMGTDTWYSESPHGGEYRCEEGNTQEDPRWTAYYDGQELDDDEDGQATPEAAQRICQHHCDTQLVWREVEPGDLWVATSTALGGADGYGCQLAEGQPLPPAPDAPWWPKTVGGPAAGSIGEESATLELAKETCQDHHRATHPLGAAELLPTAEPAPLGKPERELVTRSILCNLTAEEHAEAGQRLAELDAEAEDAERAVKLEAERYRERRKELEEIWGSLVQEKRQIRAKVRTGQEERLLEVHERLGPDKGDGSPRDVIYTDPATGEELDRRPATREELQKWLPNVSEETLTEQEAAMRRIEDMVDMEPATEPPPTDEPESEPAHDAPPEPLKWRRVPGGSMVWVTKGRDPEYRVDLASEPGQVLITSGPQGVIGKHVELFRWKFTGNDAAAQAKRGKAWCQEHLNSRLRWSEYEVREDGIARRLADSTGQYEIGRSSDGTMLHGWHAAATYLGGQDEAPQQLGEWDAEVGQTLADITELAKAECQRDADGRAQ